VIPAALDPNAPQSGLPGPAALIFALLLTGAIFLLVRSRKRR
jgi:hypothetical protein